MLSHLNHFMSDFHLIEWTDNTLGKKRFAKEVFIEYARQSGLDFEPGKPSPAGGPGGCLLAMCGVGGRAPACVLRRGTCRREEHGGGSEPQSAGILLGIDGKAHTRAGE